MLTLAPGQTLADYRIEAVAGKGAMGVVYRARHVHLDRLIALKVVAASLAEKEDFRKRFQRECRLAAKVDHPNIVPVHDARTTSTGELFVAMRYVEGNDLGDEIDLHGTLEPQRAAAIVSQIAAALEAAHAFGLVHRDVKPGNILLEQRDGREQAFLTDFGLAKANDVSSVTRTGVFVGTVDYAAPEQIRGERVDPRTDVYALGCVLYHSLAGDSPFGERTSVGRMFAHLGEEPPSLRERNPRVPDGLARVVERALRKHAHERFQTAEELGEAALEAAAPSNGRPRPAPPPTTRKHLELRAEPVPESGRPPERPAPAATPRTSAAKPELPWWMPRRRALRLAALVAGLLALPLGVTAAILAWQRNGTTRVVATIPIPKGARALAFGEGSLWLPYPTRGRLEQVDADSNERTKSIKVGGRPIDVAVTGGRAWTYTGDGQLTPVDTATGRVGPKVPVPVGSLDLVGTSKTLWLAYGDKVVPLEPRTGRPQAAAVRLPSLGTPAPKPMSAPVAAQAGRSLYTADTNGDIDVINTRRRSKPRLVDTLLQRGLRGHVYSSGGDIYFMLEGDGGLRFVRLDPDTEKTRTIARISDRPGRFSFTFGAGSLWLCKAKCRGRITRTDLQTTRPDGEPFELDTAGYVNLEYRYGSLWAVGQGELHRIEPAR